LGDCSTVTNANIFANYGEALEAEVVQVAHHGYDGGSTGLYEKINPIYVFWPAGGTWYSTCENNATENPATDRSAYFFLSGTRVDMIYPALARVIIMDINPSVGFGFSGGKVYSTIDDYIAGVSSPAPLD
ncbi:MAG: hypothetical protein J6B77_09185, partial [Clostridia bacterium]|nr:hypothetical protein [Clostridia bacterium]